MGSEIERLRQLSREIDVLQKRADKVGGLEEDKSALLAEVKMWKEKAHDLAMRSETRLGFARDTLEIRVSLNREFIHFSRNPNEIVLHSMRQMEGYLNEYLRRADPTQR